MCGVIKKLKLSPHWSCSQSNHARQHKKNRRTWLRLKKSVSQREHIKNSCVLSTFSPLGLLCHSPLFCLTPDCSPDSQATKFLTEKNLSVGRKVCLLFDSCQGNKSNSYRFKSFLIIYHFNKYIYCSRYKSYSFLFSTTEMLVKVTNLK